MPAANDIKDDENSVALEEDTRLTSTWDIRLAPASDSLDAEQLTLSVKWAETVLSRYNHVF